MKVGYDSAWDPIYYWKDRVKVVPGLKTHWYLNIQNYIDNLFDFSPSLTLTVYKNLDLTFSSVSNNTRTYLYIPGWSRSALGESAHRPPRSPSISPTTTTGAVPVSRSRHSR